MNFRTLDDFKLKGKNVLLRIDINSEIVKGKPVMSERISQSAKTIIELKRKKAKVVILAHQGRPEDKDFTSLKAHAKLLNKFVKVNYVSDILGKKALKAIQNLKDGQAILLENIRSIPEELTPKEPNPIIQTLAPFFDIYVNDAFSVSHRDQTSITGFPKVLESAVGRLMQHELESIEKLNVQNALFILGGEKEEDIKIIQNCQGKIITCGIFGQLCAIAKGMNFGAQNKFLKEKIEKIVPKLQPLANRITTPRDFAVKAKGQRKELKAEEFPSNYEIFDIGEETINYYVKEIKKAKTILMKGTAGYCEEKQFCKGTRALYKAIANSKAFKVLGGGHASTALKQFKIPKSKFNYISLSGGAFVSYLAGEKLPGLEVLEKR
jgi:phosphoglycerate kinase